MRNIIFIILSIILSTNISAQATIDDFEGRYTFSDNSNQLTITLKKVRHQGAKRDIIMGNITYIKEGKTIIDQRNELKNKITAIEKSKNNNEVVYGFEEDINGCIIRFNKAKQIFTLTKLNDSQYVLEYSETITNNFINSPTVSFFKNIVPEYELPKKIILTKQRK